MTPEAERSRSYLYGYYCGYTCATNTNGMDEDFVMGWEDGKGDRRQDVPYTLVCLNASVWADRNEMGLVLGTIHPHEGLCLYFEATSIKDVADSIWVWDSTPFSQTQKPRGWQRVR